MSRKNINRKNHFVLKIFLTLIALIVFFCAFELYISKYWLTTTDYTISTNEISSPFRIVQLTDLHDSVFGKNNAKLVSRVEAENPDLILFSGDLVNSKTGEDTSTATELITELVQIAPVYVSYGNQEKDLEENYGVDITSLYSAAGTTVLERSYMDTEINGISVRIGGIYGYCLPDKFAQETGRQDESAFLKEFQSTDAYTILMCHMPYAWLESGSLEDWDIDAVFAGHAHGGQVRIPFVGGLWAPDQGWFPGEECGVYTTTEEEWNSVRQTLTAYNSANLDNSYYENGMEYEESNLILSRGLGNSDKMPRFNNIPEIVTLDFEPAG